VLVGSAENMARARVQRKRLGGGWRQAGMLAAGALYALEHQLDRMAEDHAAARDLAEAVAEHAPAAVDVDSLETNIVVLRTGDRAAAPLAAAAAEQGVLVSVLGPRIIRAVTHLDVPADACAEAGKVLGALLAS
jgi:threonine aldolase